MKRIILSVLTMSALLCGCQKDHVSELAQGRGTIQATIEEISATRTVMDENNNIRWSEGDLIVGFMKSTLGVKYQVTAASVGKTSASFEEVSNGGLNAGTELEHIIAYYPYSSSVSAAKSGSNYTLDVILPTEQSYVAESFGNGAMPMVAVSETNNITFRNVCGGLKLQLKGDHAIKTIKVTGNNNELLAGMAKVTAFIDGSNPQIEMHEGAFESVILDCGETGVQLNNDTPTVFIISLPPTEFSKGFTVNITDVEGRPMALKTSQANSVLRSSLLKMPEANVEVDMDSSIVFEDEVMKEMCVNAFDTNGDGELSYAEAAAVTNLSKMTLTKKTFKSFNEFKYFSSVKMVPDNYFKGIAFNSISFPDNIHTIGVSSFESCINLKIVHLPKKLLYIKEDAFRNCKGIMELYVPQSLMKVEEGAFFGCYDLHSVYIQDLQSWCSCSFLGDNVAKRSSNPLYHSADLYLNGEKLINLEIPSTVTNIAYKFAGCTSIKSVKFLSNITDIGNFAFSHCTNLENIVFPSTLSSISKGAFQFCENLVEIYIPNTVSSIGVGAFSVCKNLKKVSLPESVSIIPDRCFSRCENLQEVNIPESISTIAEYAFADCSSLNNIVIPESVSVIEECAFEECTSLVDILLPDSVTYLGVRAFRNCTNLKYVTLSSNITYIYREVFYGCSSLAKFFVKALTPPSLPYGIEFSSDLHIYVPAESLDAYKSADGWSNYADIIVGYDFVNNKVVE